MILADLTSGQQLAVGHFVVDGTVASTKRVPDSSKNVNECGTTTELLLKKRPGECGIWTFGLKITGDGSREVLENNGG